MHDSFLRSCRIQMRVIGALLMREIITRYGRHNIGFLWLFIEPMIFTLGITVLWNMSKATQGSHLPITAFAVTGYSSVLLWRNMPARCVGAIAPNLSLMYHRNVRVMDILVSRILLEVAGTTMSFFTLSLIFISVGSMRPPEDMFKVIFGWFMIAWFGAALGVFIGAMSERSELVEKIWHPLAYLMFPLSGSVFMVEWLPQSVQKIVLWIPIVHGVELLREGYFGYAVKAHYSLSYMAMCCLILTLVGISQERVVSRQVTPE